jgi:collagen type I/II/III/V/XI/XXIV/XXVII alpha
MYGGMNLMKKGLLRVCMAGVILTAASSSLFATVFVGAMSDIFEAGLGTPGTAVGTPNMGLFPVLGTTITPGAGQTISFNQIGLTGETALCGTTNCTAAGADGAAGLAGASNTNITSNTGISGISFNLREFFLVGVFLTAAAPTPGTQPASGAFVSPSGGLDPDGRTNWFDPSTTFAIGQTFYIGDGKTGFCATAGAACAGATQVWNVPTNATALYLGFADGGSSGPFQGAFGAYNDNTGGFTVNINTSGLIGSSVPEPGTLALLGIGLLGLGFLRKKLA